MTSRTLIYETPLTTDRVECFYCKGRKDTSRIVVSSPFVVLPTLVTRQSHLFIHKEADDFKFLKKFRFYKIFFFV